jgi:hypothetical protein
MGQIALHAARMQLTVRPVLRNTETRCKHVRVTVARFPYLTGIRNSDGNRAKV